MTDWVLIKLLTPTVTQRRRHRNVLLNVHCRMMTIFEFWGHIPNPFQRNRKILNVYVNRTPPSLNSYETRFICYIRNNAVCHMTPSQTNASVRTYRSYHSKCYGPPELLYDLPQRKSDTSPGPLQVTDLNATVPNITTSSPMINNQRNVLHNSQSSQPWQTSGVTVLAYTSKSGAPTITNWKNTDIDEFERYCTESRLFQFPKDEAWRALNQVFPYKTMDTLQVWST